MQHDTDRVKDVYHDHAPEGFLLMEMAVCQDKDQLVQPLAAAALGGSVVARQVQHVHQHRQQLHHRPVCQRVVLSP